LLGLLGLGCANEPPTAARPAPARTEDPTTPFVASDVVLVIDRSTMALLSSGVDVDGDGVVGRNRSWLNQMDRISEPQFFTTDRGDTVAALQMKLALALVPALAARGNRVGLASQTFRAHTRGTTLTRLAEKPEVLVPVGPPEPVLAALAEFPEAQERRQTDLGQILARSAELFDQETTDETDAARPRTLLLLSLGKPSAPDGIGWSSRRALEVARDLEAQGIAVWAVPLGVADASYLDELTRITGGGVVPLDQLGARFGAREQAH
jgi:hypothetical protein